MMIPMKATNPDNTMLNPAIDTSESPGGAGVLLGAESLIDKQTYFGSGDKTMPG